MRAWSPERSTSGRASRGTRTAACSADTRGRPRARRRSSRRAPSPRSRARPGSRRAIASTITIAGSSPPDRTYGPIEMASEARCVTMRSSNPSKREDRSVELLLGGELLDGRLVELAALRCQRDDTVVGDAAVDGVECCRNHVHAQHHSGAAAVGVIVDLARPQRGRVAVAEQPQVEAATENGGDGTLLGEPAEGMRNEGENVELQRKLRLPVVGEARSDNDSAPSRSTSGRRRRRRVARGRSRAGYVVGDARGDLGHAAERGAVLLDRLQSDQVGDVEGARQPARGARSGRSRALCRARPRDRGG